VASEPGAFKGLAANRTSVTLPLFLLGVRKAAGGELKLLICGKDKEPLVTVMLQKAETVQKLPLEFSAYPGANDVVDIELHLVGQYQASFQVIATRPE